MVVVNRCEFVVGVVYVLLHSQKPLQSYRFFVYSMPKIAKN